jgi:phosphoribosylanthranilate isomerase
MKIKVCGITTVEQLKQLQDMNVDYAGLIFYPKSKRYAYEKLTAQKAEIRSLEIKKVGVFVNAGMGFLKSCIAEYGLSAVQLHGDETPEFCDALKNEIDVIKVLRIGNVALDIDERIRPFQNSCAYFLFDTDTAEYGGSGKRFDWTVLQEATIGKPFFLSGGIGPDDMEKVKRFSHPYFQAIDINSRFESTAGIKNMESVNEFVNQLKAPSLWIK